MNLKTAFSKPQPTDEFLAVKISATEICAAVSKISSGKVETEEVHSASFSDADQVIARTPSIKKVIFGLPFSWISDGKIVSEKLSLLRRLCHDHELVPLGYVPLSQALENYFHSQEGAPLTAILLELDGEMGQLTMYRGGKNIGATPIPGSLDDLNSNLENALKQFPPTEVLPSRIIICDGQAKLAEIAQNITSYPWTKNLPFLHFPKVEIIKSEQMVQAIAVAAGHEMEANFEAVEETPPTQPEVEEISAEEAGFVPESQFNEMAVVSAPKMPRVKLTMPRLNLTENVKKIISLLPKPHHGPPFALLGLFLGAAVILLALVIYFLPMVTVILTFSTPTFDHNMTVSVVTDKSTKPASDSARAITGSFLSVTEIGTKQGIASGKQLVGEKARGSVTIYSASSEKTFPAGTILTSPAGLKFTLDGQTSVASGDAISRSTATAAVTAADIGANYNLPAGTKFTLANFSPSSYAAQSDQGLSGGSSHQATVVTKDDQSRLSATVSAELTDKSRPDLEAKLLPGQKLLPAAITSRISQKKFSKDVGSEAEFISLDMTIDFEAVIFSQTDLVQIFAQNFSSDIPESFVLSPEQTSLEILDIKTDKSGISLLNSRLTAPLLPKINSQEIVTNISGQSLAKARAYLSNIPGVTNISVETKPKWLSPAVQFVLPWKKDRLRLDIVRS